MTGKIFRSIFAVTSAVLLLSLAVIIGVLYRQFSDVQMNQLKAELSLAVRGVELGADDYLSSLEEGNFNYRITWVDKSGNVLFDTKAEPDAMGNHLDREEIREAFENGEGESSRYSSTLTEKTMYRAVLLSDGTVLRISASSGTILALLFDVLIPFVFVFAAAVIISSILARSMARRIVKPINELDLDNPLENDTYDELSPLLGRINKQHKQITEHIARLKSNMDEFEQIISAMSEGLVLLNKNGSVISINNAAKRIFGISGECIGDNFLKLNHDLDFSQAVEAALGGESICFDVDRNGRIYRFNINGITAEIEYLGAVILAFDVTEQVSAEKARKEFTANVSHELKTPLQTIIGSAELLENKLVKPEDTERFIGHIKNEASRLVTLVNDIIHLSQLDENIKPAHENIDLCAVAGEVVSQLSASAENRNVSLSITGESTEIVGIRKYIHEIIYNLCDNSIRYNKEGGSVCVNISHENEKAVITVSDTGIGIAPKHQPRIFERFYRADKSHSKETGGTGLGLSIVKHAVQLHGGTVELESIKDKGTTVKVVL